MIPLSSIINPHTGHAFRPQDYPSIEERSQHYEKSVQDPEWDPNTFNLLGYTPLIDLIAYDGNPELVKRVLAHPRVDVNMGSDEENFTPLIMASAKKGKEGKPVYLELLNSCGKEFDRGQREKMWNMTAADHEQPKEEA